MILWPFSLKAAVRLYNNFKVDEKGLTPLEKVSKLEMRPSVKNEHPLFCPVYVLDSKQQGGRLGFQSEKPGHDLEYTFDTHHIMSAMWY